MFIKIELNYKLANDKINHKSKGRRGDLIRDTISERFACACEQVIDQRKFEQGIGTLSEKTVHAVLKYFYEPDNTNHEQKVGSYVADILHNQQVIEIQTRNFNVMRRKLDIFLEKYKVIIVYPLIHHKKLYWINPETGEVSAGRKSPKTGSIYKIFPELYRIKDFLMHPNLQLRIVSLDIEEYRMLDGWGKDKKKGSTKNDGIPTALLEETTLSTVTDYKIFLPNSLPKQFTTADYKGIAHISKEISGVALNILHYIGLIDRVGKKGNFYLYKIVE